MSYYQNYFKYYAQLNIHIAQISEWIKNKQIDRIYHSLLSAEKEIEFIYPILKELNCLSDESVEQALANLAIQKDKILSFFESWFDQHLFSGDALAFESPDIAILLGANQPILDHRIKESIPYFERHPKLPVLFSGGGFSSIQSEAAYMHMRAKEAGLKNPMLTEDRSMDTLGNALFSKFELLKKQVGFPINKILILTSRFHIPRALHYFKYIFNSDYTRSIAAYGIATEDSNLKRIIAHELTSEYQADRQLGIFDNHPNNPIDDQAILLKLFKNHALYQKRYDILERYLSIA